MLVVVRGHEGVAAGLRDAGCDVVTTFPDVFDALVHVPDPAAVVPAPLLDLDEAAWVARGEELLHVALRDCQRAHAGMREHGGRIVLVTPTVALTGADGLVPYAMAAEGIRTLAKAAARQWGSLAITANCVAPSLDVFGIRHDADGSVAPALARFPTLQDLVTVIAALLGETGAIVTGMTVTVDGGVVMAP